MLNLFDNVILCDQLENLPKDAVLDLVNNGKFVIFPHEWHNRQKQIKNHFQSYTQKITTIGARKCTVREINLSVLRQYCDSYHIQGSNKLALKAWGIFDINNDLLGVLSLGRHHRQNDVILLDRLCFNSNIRVVGGASKLMSNAKKWAIENGIKEITSFSDKRWSNGTVYEKMEFIRGAELKPDYFYVEGENQLKYHSKQSQKKSSNGCPENITEKEWTEQKGLIRIYDAGKIRWVLHLTKQLTIKNPISKRRTSYHNSLKAGLVYCDSSYELKAAVLLDQDENVITYTNHVPFIMEGRNRVTDFLITKKNGNKIIEIKPERRLEEFKEQIEDNKKYARENNWEFEVWTEKNLGFASEYYATKWADEYLSKIKGIDYVDIRKQRNLEKSHKHYKNKISKNKIKIYCNYCNEYHEILELCYKKNIAKNGKFICIIENGHLIGKRPKKKKINPYAVDGKKQCNACKEIKTFEEFSPDKTKTDGYSTRCKICRASVYKAKYQNKIK